ncbi:MULTISPECIES: serine hydrolase [unclassified Spirosoma]|uniref:serine hydrolase domain-containing protein n=1 Tax=unclassified Spirosoma TaxID=2621999 RepID=UPI0009594A6A|nr:MULTISPECIES: serine hydrolase domain-containing protein [unclassified Spirosoma]MBN8822375.1 beta-lactamase family protein [Spirosoma sp.]OJW72328.1 MAG: serine hydrolase [Spirosoma sp. 48-14]
MNRYVSIAWLLSCLLSYTYTAKGQPKATVLTEAAPAVGGFSADRLARLDAGMDDWVKQKWVNGSVVLIARHGKIVFYKAHGYNDLTKKVPLDKNGIFRVASQTKALTCVSVMMLWEEGKFSLADPVSKFIPSFANAKVLATFNPKDTTYTTVPAKRPVTIRDLLTHTSGLGYPAIGTPAENAIYAKSNMTGGVGVKGQKLSDAMTRLGTLPLFFQPGEQWRYGLNMDVLGYLVELWSGMSLEAFFQKRICQPLGMKDTYFNLPSEKGPRLVNFFLGDSTGTIQKQASVFGGALDMNYPLQKTDYFSGGGGLSSTVYDYAIFLQMLLNGGEYNGVRLLARNTVRLMTMNQIGDLNPNIGDHARDNTFGFGFLVISENGSKFTPSQVGTYSWGGVFSTSYWVDPKEDMLVLIYRQMWGPYVSNTDKAFKPLVYQAIND